MTDRRQVHDRHEKGRGIPRLRWLAIPAFAALLGWLGHTLGAPDLLPVRKVRFSGELARFEKVQLQRAVASYVGEGFLWLDVDGVRAGLESLPWVYSASVRRLWPDTVEIEIREQRPLARWGEASLLNDEGGRFSPPAIEWPAGLPVFRGPEGSAQAMAARYRELREVLAPVGLGVASIDLSERRAWIVELDNGMEVLLGRSDHEPRLERFVLAYPKVLAGRSEVERVDLRYTNGFAVALKKQAPGA